MEGTMDPRIGEFRIEGQGDTRVVMFTAELPVKVSTALAAVLVNVVNTRYPTVAKRTSKAQRSSLSVVAPSTPEQAWDDLAKLIASGQGDLWFALFMVAAGAIAYAACVRYLM